MASNLIDPKIIQVELVKESFKRYRALHGDNTGRYPVKVTLSRPVDPYERMVLRGVGIVVDDSDPIMAIIYDTSLDHVGTGMPALIGKIATAVGRARMAREAAEQEDSRLTALEERINNELKPA